MERKKTGHPTRLALLDYGRFFAACSVVAFHYFFNGISNGKISSLSEGGALVPIVKYGYLGVELFFMISGYVIFFSALDRRPSQFALSRLARLFPAYWFAVLLTSGLAFFWGGEKMGVTPLQVLVNLTMLGGFFGWPYVDGVYWSLTFELIFYSAVFVVLLAGGGQRLPQLFIAWPFVMACAWATGLDRLVMLGGYYCYFAAGAAFGALHRQPCPIAVASVVLSAVLCLHVSLAELPHLSASRHIGLARIFRE